ncbi:MAG TPA: tRNA (N(6)-L-threonylcarbamoyladenosine(37)-C(2))-methylthiotransferase MtaB [Terriglobales bacterium]|nr:tRNA (N(6)-L-threonylcarbamoyladenosine(37)-C(2))-methylthiotransferase MtaB [Terriglobales bacterium]
MATFYVENFGCRATQADGAAIERQLAEKGWRRRGDPRLVDVVVVNTCTVTSAADHDARAAIRRIHRQNPECRILVTGCYAQRAPQEVGSLPGVSWVVGNSHKHQIGEIALRAPGGNGQGFVPLGSLDGTGTVQVVGDIFAHTELLAAPVFEGDAAGERTRPNLKVQDGCDNRCSFCIIPSVRGQSRSLPQDEVLREMDALVAAGYREVVISGINLGRWGRDFERPQTFAGLVRAVVEKTGIERLRISSVEPMDWTDELIELVASSPRIAKHAHVPLQSGSDRILRLMHRKYRPWHYAARVRKIRKAMPTAAIGADVMVGFPGETDADFEDNRRFIESLPFTYLHVFTYSSRPGTPSARMAEQVEVAVRRERNRELRGLAAAKKRAFLEGFVGSTLSGITLNVREGEYTESLTDNYLKLMLRGRHGANQMVTARAESVQGEALLGSVC